MNKGLEAFNELKEGHWFDFANTYFSLNPKLKMDLDIIKNELKEKEQQDEIIKTIKEIISFKVSEPEFKRDEDGSIQNIIGCVYFELKREIENKERELFRNWVLETCFSKEFKALEIIKKKRVNVYELVQSRNYVEYNNIFDENEIECFLTQEDYNLLKEVLL